MIENYTQQSDKPIGADDVGDSAEGSDILEELGQADSFLWVVASLISAGTSKTLDKDFSGPDLSGVDTVNQPC